MAFEDLTMNIGADASGLVSETDTAGSALTDLSTDSGTLRDELFDLDPAGIAAGAGLVGVATAAQRLLDDTQDLRSSLNETAVDMGLTQEETSDLAREMSDATFPIGDVTGTMATLSDQGIDTAEDMRAVAQASDLIADATGTTAESVANTLGPAMRGLGDDLEDMEGIADTVTLAVQNTTLETEDLARVMEGTREELVDLGVDTEEATALIAAYGDETGLSGRQLRRQFRQELREADGDMDAFMESTGLSEEAVRQFSGELNENVGVAEEYADANNANITTMDRLRASFDDVRLQAAGVLGPFDALIPAAQAAGIAMIGLSTINMGAVIPSLVGVMAAASPILIPLAALAAAGAALAAAWHTDFAGIRSFTEETFGRIVDLAEPPLSLLRDDFLETMDVWRDGVEGAMEPVADRWERHGDTVMGILGFIQDFIVTYAATFIDTFAAIGRSLLALARGDVGALEEIWGDWFDSQVDRWVGFGSDLMGALVDGLRDRLPDVEGGVEAVAETITSYLPGSDADRGPLSNLTASWEAIPETGADAMADGSAEVGTAAEGMAGEAAATGARNGSAAGRDPLSATEIRTLIRDGVIDAFDALQLVMALDIDDRDFSRFVREEARLEINEVVR